MITHISTDVCLDMDCSSWALHNRPSSLLLLCSLLTMTVLASLSVLVGVSEHQKLDSLLFAWLISQQNVYIFASTIKKNSLFPFNLYRKYSDHGFDTWLAYSACCFPPHTRCRTGTIEATCSYFWWLEHGWKAEWSNFKMRSAPGLSCYSTSLWGPLNAFPRGWTESSISLELTKTGASGEKLECNGSSVSHRVHASRETQQSCQGSAPHLSLLHSSSNLNWPSEISFSTIIHNKAAYSFTSLSHLFVWPQDFNWLYVELLLLTFTTPLGNVRL